MVSGSCRRVLLLERLLSHRGGLVTSSSVARLSHHRVERIRFGLGGQVTRRSFALSSQDKMTRKEVTKRLRANEFTMKDLPAHGSVTSVDADTLESNNPRVDSHAQAILPTGAMLFGVFDGHGGAACSKVVAGRLFEYISAALLPPEKLTRHLHAVENDDKTDPDHSFVNKFNHNTEIVEDLENIYLRSYINYLKTLSQKQENIHDVKQILTNSFMCLDDDISAEAIMDRGASTNMKTAMVAMSGCVAAAAYVDGIDLYVAGCGDCTAVVGHLTEADHWTPIKLTTEHNADNQLEVERILAEHPDSESHNIIKGGRLLSQLAPFRAFGDFYYKWDIHTIQEVIGVPTGFATHYRTPPYLTARPEVSYHRLTPRDKFLVVASDGLWDMLTPMQVVRMVGEYINGKSLHNDTNASTHLMRNALGLTANGVSHEKITAFLSLPQHVVRRFRDDITIQVVFFNDEYHRKHQY